ncbi:hypothetical protein GCM10009678_27850 [Actinomadura kijaniata]|uniref:hypothetical protein n=1 Tax=Actinomadura kijaniata TaxID=46161 RepID=UPI002FE819D7
MSGDLGPEAADRRDRPDAERRRRPEFLPPEGAPPPPPPAPDTQDIPGTSPSPPGSAEEPRRRAGLPDAAWNVLNLVAAAALLVAAFLPWVHARMVLGAFGDPVTHDAGSAAGIDVDGTVLVVPVLALTAAAMTFWSIAVRDPRIAALTAVPGGLALLACGLFVLRLDSARAELGADGPLIGYRITVGYGWYLAVAAALLVVGFALARPLAARLSRRSRDGAAAWGRAASP